MAQFSLLFPSYFFSPSSFVFLCNFLHEYPPHIL
uniref:Uncharacterized protein n=1 Tax=Anguilla anguilla TaxID=7936 RepID=A0A0E9PS97_ANGAN